MLQDNNLISAKIMFWYFLLLSFLLWLLPFVLRLFFIDAPEIKKPPQAKSLDIVNEITYYAIKNDSWSVSYLIFINNLKVSIINIAGGVFIGITTIFNLIINGFFAADTFATLHKNGMGVDMILQHTLPHCFEMIGIWLSGAIGFSLSKVIID